MWLSFAVFLVMRPYEGIVHDARLYVGYALAPLDPDGIGLDILFQQDGQSGYSIYPVFLREMVRLIGPAAAAMVTSYLALALWFLGAWRFAGRFAPRVMGAGALALVLVLATSLHTYYGGSTTFHFAEPFASPRTLAEACVLLGLSFALGGAAIPSALWLLTAMAIHPLMAIGGAAAAVFVLLPSNRMRWYAAAMGGLAVCALLLGAWFGVPLGGLTARFDGEWKRVLQDYGSLVFLSGWEPLDFARLLVHLSTVAIAYRLLTAKGQRLLVAVVVMACSSLALTFVGADHLQMVLIAQAQPWRVLWLLAFVSAVLLGVILLSLRSSARNANEAAFRTAGAYTLVLAWCMVGTSTAAATLSMLAAFLWWLPAFRPGLTVPGSLVRVAPVVALMLLAVIAAAEASVVLPLYAASPAREMLWLWPTWVLAGVPRFAVACAVVPALAGLWPAKAARSWQPVTAAVLTLALFFTFDSRSRYQRSVEQGLVQQMATARTVISGPVLWPDGELEPWAFLGSAGYGSIIQGTPRVFSRDLAMQWGARRRQLLSLEASVKDPRYRLGMERLYHSPEAMQELCSAGDPPTAVALLEAPGWSQTSTRFELPAPQLLPPQDPGQPWEVRSVVYLVACSEWQGASRR
ncbi:hypothetical protein [Gemmatimonas phototrophica]|uniref:Uncharacterized protein n=1 Tax=Gemmatimonas phototrophica TaxID=1379270 RepID=A0A143BMI6_9BACT|nr:hypothetical protein [Gemmatimonas phototrophica]AMW05823.1 hypothetical protein GEMMAAP_15505 [Gemmatimonas phototrophica]